MVAIKFCSLSDTSPALRTGATFALALGGGGGIKNVDFKFFAGDQTSFGTSALKKKIEEAIGAPDMSYGIYSYDKIKSLAESWGSKFMLSDDDFDYYAWPGCVGSGIDKGVYAGKLVRLMSGDTDSTYPSTVTKQQYDAW